MDFVLDVLDNDWRSDSSLRVFGMSISEMDGNGVERFDRESDTFPSPTQTFGYVISPLCIREASKRSTLRLGEAHVVSQLRIVVTIWADHEAVKNSSG